ncbi:N-acetyl-1-D-myo-inositol-2-amino-2-deoxy-alpha-D-glucopyranoside deacetylase [Prauserella muralis]|uniref:N-acetyl-1-D-myo-inositol-2-amino-2-deoxy-alpha- D-glucopyranoside deacetylase n=1 Tax=Prauserella muralis TaxID=588067 RepID=UPI0011ADA5E9|nr:N-acetyl-1-D-myo-inositol-2-amino-2-deoxy-alpha-D-glucopyranoside deacetylase [Prauserella muralis]TWE30180.1 N-acetyl-1-D-myo-inositol-2-amino-2-deoxy-alpha-D-glucopyranoside deacetylase [Prauserella muralis]
MLFVHAHPDDETITTGGTIARYAAAGAHVTVVTCTLGEEGEIIPPALEQLGAWAADQLGGYRAGELAAAGAALGWTEHHYLGGIGRWRDSGMAGTPSAEHPRALVKGSVEEQTGQLLAVLEELRPEVVVTYDSFGGYGHPDHIRAHEITMAAAARASSVRRVFHTVSSAGATARGLEALRQVGGLPFRVPADGELPTVADEHITTAIDITGQVRVKLAALRAHATQVSVHEPAFALSNGIAQPVPAAEYFVLADGPAAGADDDLFGGLDP